MDGRSHPPSFGFAIGLLLQDLPEQTWKAPTIPPGRLEATLRRWGLL
ncbi:hypothetical protein [Azotobacter beijerinckii]|nr:hypothetical protein [Azotobacter beijerinckii]